MGYQDNYVGLRPGRSVEKLRSDSGMPSNLGTAQTGRGFRTSGAISPLWGNQVPKKTEAKAEDGAKALSTYYAPQMPSFNIPKAPGFGEQLAMNVGGKIATDAAGKALGNFFAPALDKISPIQGASVPFDMAAAEAGGTGNVIADMGGYGNEIGNIVSSFPLEQISPIQSASFPFDMAAAEAGGTGNVIADMGGYGNEIGNIVSSFPLENISPIQGASVPFD